MAFTRGSGTVEVELSRVQSWIETADPELFGRDGEDVGVIREHRAYQTERMMSEKFFRRAVTLMGVLGGIPAVLLLLQILHVIPK